MSRHAPRTALVLAAGLGTRLGPLTAARAKPSLPVAGAALIERIAGWLADGNGIHELIVNLHHRPETVTAILGDGARQNVRVRYSWEHPLLGSAGGPRRAFSLTADERLWLVNGDTLCNVALDAMAVEHSRSDALVTLAVIPNPNPARYGGVGVDGDVVTGFLPRGTGPSWHFVGVQIAERAAFDALTDGVPAESVRTCYPALIAARRGSVRAFRTAGAFHDIGTAADYLTACLDFSGGNPARLVTHGSLIDAAARVEETVVWEDVTVAPHARLRQCIVMNGARVPEGFIADRQIVLPDLSLQAIA